MDEDTQGRQKSIVARPKGLSDLTGEKSSITSPKKLLTGLLGGW